VKGRHGRFIVCESMNNIKWKDNPSDEMQKRIYEALKPLEIIKKRKNGVYEVKAFMILKDALFKVDIYVEPNGNVTMSDHDIILENIPIIDSSFGS